MPVARPRPMGEIAYYEAIKILIVSSILLGAQLLLSFFYGFGGLRNAILLYILATICSDMVSYDSTKGLQFKAEGDIAAIDYSTRMAVNIGMVAGAMVTWLIASTTLGLEKTIGHSQEPEEILKQMNRSNFLVKISLAFISHVALFSFMRFWTNIYNGIIASWIQYK